MDNTSFAMRLRPDDRPNHLYRDLTRRFEKRDNAEFLAEVATELAGLAAKPAAKDAPRFDPTGRASIVLLGTYGLLGYRVRCAQELLRIDGTPSHWSHAFLLPHGLGGSAEGNRGPSSPWIWESPLEPGSASREIVRRSGVALRRLGEYARAEHAWFGFQGAPNIAVVSIGLTDAEREAVVQKADVPDLDQVGYDFVSLQSRWSSYIRRRDGEGNPLAAGVAFPAAAYVQYAYDGAGIDLAPGGHQRNTAPEHIWQASKHLHEMLAIVDPKTGKRAPRPVAVWACLRDRAGVVYPAWYRSDRKLPRRMTELEGAIEGKTAPARSKRRRSAR